MRSQNRSSILRDKPSANRIGGEILGSGLRGRTETNSEHDLCGVPGGSGKTSQVITFTVHMPTPSLNETQRMHWAKRAKLASMWHLAIAVKTNHAPRATGKRKLVIDRRGKRALDADNLVGGAKAVIDVIKKLGLIVDDNAANLDLEVRQTKLDRGMSPHTFFTIEDL